jgi:hypothetical protein
MPHKAATKSHGGDPISRELQEIILREAVQDGEESEPRLSLRDSINVIEQRQCTSVEFYLRAMWQRMQIAMGDK